MVDKGVKQIDVITVVAIASDLDVWKIIANVTKQKYLATSHANALDVKMWMKIHLEGKHVFLLDLNSQLKFQIISIKKINEA